MLLRFKVSNYKSFLNEVEFSMVPAPKQKDLEYSVLKQIVNNKTYKALSTSVIYGSNASGKTNIIGAFEAFVEIIKRGHLKNADVDSPNVAAYLLEYIPNVSLSAPVPTSFYFEAIINDKHVIYELEIDLGVFLDNEYKRHVVLERLLVNDNEAFIRNNGEVKFNDISNKEANDKYHEIIAKLLNDNLEADALFITNGFRNAVNNDLATEIINYLTNKMMILYRADSLKVSRVLEKGRKQVVDEEISEVARRLSSCGEKIVYVANEKEGEEATMAVTINTAKAGKELIRADIIESYGTFRFLNIYPLIKIALKKGGTIIIDEFDASLHPMLIMHMINIFHNDEINKNNAQLIFNTHNPIFLSNTLFRRDEIKLVEKENNTSIIYSLADFGTSGTRGVRNSDKYMQNYLLNKYGAISDIDLTDLLT